ncbi:unnamed protein product [Dovyalis caffra]|uniref:Uncharacterized protein n=1 Tax=Dovyalis caffra TaxID=77055 RepID=A0AAV1S404_9ROSI|nr:unnamed protein product [Dovyalis caffra]
MINGHRLRTTIQKGKEGEEQATTFNAEFGRARLFTPFLRILSVPTLGPYSRASEHYVENAVLLLPQREKIEQRTEDWVYARAMRAIEPFVFQPVRFSDQVDCLVNR